MAAAEIVRVFGGNELGFSRRRKEAEEVKVKVEKRIRVWQGWKGRPGQAVAEMAAVMRKIYGLFSLLDKTESI